MDGIKKQINRFNQRSNQILGRAEKTEVLATLAEVERRIELLVRPLDDIIARLQDCLRLKEMMNKNDLSKYDSSKKLTKFKEYQLLLTLRSKVAEMQSAGRACPTLLYEVLTYYKNAMENMWDEQLREENDILERIVYPVREYAMDLKGIHEKRDNLKKKVLDMDSARFNRDTICSQQTKSGKYEKDKIDKAESDLNQAQTKVDQAKEDLLIAMYTLASKEVDLANLYSLLIHIQLEYHRTIVRELEIALPKVQHKIDMHPYRPVFAAALEDHLRYSGRKIALVLEVCCSALNEIGALDIEGIFRLSGSGARIRKLRAAFDSGEIIRTASTPITLTTSSPTSDVATPLDDIDRDPHALTGALKSYLRELPDTLTTHKLYQQWSDIATITNERAAIDSIKLLLKELPAANYENLKYLIKFMALVASYEQKNKMPASNLGIVIGPNIIASSAQQDAALTQSMNSSSAVTALMIQNASELFPGEIEFTSDFVRMLSDQTGGFLTNQSQNRARDINNDRQVLDARVSAPPAPQQHRPKAKAPPPPDPADKNRISSSSLYDNVGEAPLATIEVDLSKSMYVGNGDKPIRPKEPPSHKKTASCDITIDQRNAPHRPPPPAVVKARDSFDSSDSEPERSLNRPTSYMVATNQHQLDDQPVNAIVADSGLDSPIAKPRRFTNPNSVTSYDSSNSDNVTQVDQAEITSKSIDKGDH